MSFPWLWARKEPPPIRPAILASYTETVTLGVEQRGEVLLPASPNAWAAWYALPCVVWLRLFGRTEISNEVLLGQIASKVSNIAAERLMGANASNSTYNEVVQALEDHVRLFIVYWLQKFANVKPGRIYANLSIFTAMMLAVFEQDDCELKKHLGLTDEQDCEEFAAAIALLVRACYDQRKSIRKELLTEYVEQM